MNWIIPVLLVVGLGMVIPLGLGYVAGKFVYQQIRAGNHWWMILASAVMGLSAASAVLNIIIWILKRIAT